MIEIIKLEKIEKHIFEIRGQKVILDSDVAKLYGVGTKRINEAVKNNPEKFPEGYIIRLSGAELNILRTKISTAKLSKTRTMPNAFTEKGLYMLATILKSKIATQTTLAIIETFAKLREFSRSINELSKANDYKEKKGLMKKSGQIITGIIEDDLKIINTETSVEFNFALVKFKHTVKRGSTGKDKM